MKFTQKKCSIKLPKTKSAKALRTHTHIMSQPSYSLSLQHDHPVFEKLLPYNSPRSLPSKERKRATHRSWLTLANSLPFSGFVWILRLAVNTNWPTVALNPARNALNGYPHSQHTHAPFSSIPPCEKVIRSKNIHNSPPEDNTETAAPPPAPGTP